MITTYLFLQGFLFLLSVGGLFKVKQFLSSNTSISSHSDLDRFKRLARGNMYVALVYVVLAIPSVLLSIYLGYTYGLYGIAIVLGTAVPQMLFGKYMKSLEDKSRNLHCRIEYADEHQRIGRAWLKNALPDF